jgi:hypothetical protein
MKVILGGYFETALVRYADAISNPDRNRTWHPYYVCLNRDVPKAYFDRAATFVALAEEVIVPSIDWGGPIGGPDEPGLSSQSLGVSVGGGPEHFGGMEWDDDTRAFVDILLDHQALSLESWVHASRFETDRMDPDGDRPLKERQDELRIQIANHYLCRLLLQVRATTDSGAYLVLSEADLAILKEIGTFLANTRLPAPYPLPDLTGQVLAGDDFAAGLLNFSPPDALAMAAVKADAQVKKYAREVTRFLHDSQTVEAQREIVRAMARAHDQAQAGRKADKVFEVATWVVKPLHYIPGPAEILSVAEDLKDLVAAWAKRKTESKEWHLLAARMTDVAISDYLSRKGNLLR